MKIYLLDRDAENYRWMEYKGNWFEFFLKLLDSEPLGKFEEKIEWKTIKEKKEIEKSRYRHRKSVFLKLIGNLLHRI